jgi:hypothetical protein
MPPQMKVMTTPRNKDSYSPSSRSPRRVMRHRSTESPFPAVKNVSHTLQNEVRDSLKMPNIGVEESVENGEVFDYVNYDDVVKMASPYHSTTTVSTSKRTTANTVANSVRYHKEIPMEQARSKWNPSDASVASSKSTKSTRSIRSFFRRKPNNVGNSAQTVGGGDDVSVAESTKSRWWHRPPQTKSPLVDTEKSNSQRRTTQPSTSFRVKKSDKTSVRGAVKNNDQLVADFFDVQSLASEPDFIGSAKLRKAALLQNESKSSRVLETQSVSSNRSQRSNVFSKFFLRMRAINDEVQDIDNDSSNLYGKGIIAYDDISLDDELTLGSGFDNLSNMGSLQDDYDDLSQGSTESRRSTSNNSDGDANDGLPSADTQLKETPFLHRIMQRRILKNESTILRDVVGLNPGSTGSSSESNIQQRPSSPIQRTRTLTQAGMKISSTKSVGDVPSVNESDDSSSSSSRPPVNRGLCRWNSDHDLASVPAAPRRPPRGTESEGGTVVSPSRSPKKTLDKFMKTSQSMRNLSCSSESKMDEDNDDDSILSLLSGLLATWSAERDAVNVVATISPQVTPCNSTWRPKSILKSFVKDSEEQKVEVRERFSVGFNSIEIREYERIVGDNPSCSKGPPISIGWNSTICRRYPINDYETIVRGPRRTKKEFHLAADARTHLLVNVWERSEDDIRKARREATYIQYCRAKTAFSGSRAAAKEAAFLRKASDRSKDINLTQKMSMLCNETVESLPKPVSRRPTIEAPPLSNRATLPTSMNSSTSVSARHSPFLEV